MSYHRWLSARWLILPAAGIATVIILSGSFSPTRPPYTGYFKLAGVPVYRTDPDSISCYLTGSGCLTPDERARRQPGPLFTSSRAGERIPDLVCMRGWFVLIDMRDGRRGWVGLGAVFADAWNLITNEYVGPPQCNILTWN